MSRQRFDSQIGSTFGEMEHSSSFLTANYMAEQGSTYQGFELDRLVRGSLEKKIPVPNESVSFHIEVLSANQFDLMCPRVTVAVTVRPVNLVHLYVIKGIHCRFHSMTSLTIEEKYQEVHFSLGPSGRSMTMSEALSIPH